MSEGPAIPLFDDADEDVDNACMMLHQTGTLSYKGADGKRSRINVLQSPGRALEYWVQNPETDGWNRMPLGELPAFLASVTVLDNRQLPGCAPWVPVTRTVHIGSST